MSESSIQSRISQHPKFKEMVGKRTRFAVLLSLLVLVPYYVFMMVTAFRPEWLAQTLAEGSVLTWGWPLGVALVVGPWLLTGVYVQRANSEFDALNQQVLREVQQ